MAGGGRDSARGDRQILLDSLHGRIAHAAILVAELSPGGERAGYVFATTKHDYFTLAPHAHVEVLAVEAGAERRGVARALMEAIERWARRRGYTWVTLDVFDWNSRARALDWRTRLPARDRPLPERPVASGASTRGQHAQEFPYAAAFRAWLEQHHAAASELEIRLFKVHAAHRGITYAQALDEALCFGWIDGVRRRLDQDSFSQRFTPRRPRSIWSRVNIAHVERLKKAARMAQAGLAAFEARDELRTRLYSFEQD